MMIARKGRCLLAAVAGFSFAGVVLAQSDRPPPLPIEPTGIVETLPRHYPEHWFLVHDFSFFHMSDGKLYVIDADADTLAEQVKGLFNNAMGANIVQSAKRGEIYSAETFYSRGTRGVRTDVVTIWDQETLLPVAEIVWPKPIRYIGLPRLAAIALLDDERLLAVANFSPATSVTLIDLDKREIINEIATPGCTMIYPAGKVGFSSLCADGRMLSTELDADGHIIKQVRTDAFFNSDESPIFDQFARIGEIVYFPSFAGLVYPVDLSGEVARVGAAWNLVPEAERSERWAPAGLSLMGQDDLGRFYVIMHPDSKDGSYQGGGPEVWVYDPVQKTRVQRIALQAWGVSLGVSRGKNPLLMVTNPINMSLEIYDALTGTFLKDITDFGQETPLVIHGAR
tara:strand:+ start:16066 stop:17256 length:1191 start_codon:yes stop_codon:yes gene_type:complete